MSGKTLQYIGCKNINYCGGGLYVLINKQFKNTPSIILITCMEHLTNGRHNGGENMLQGFKVG